VQTRGRYFMNDDQSPIQSTSVRLGTGISSSAAQSRAAEQPWTVLVFADLGFVVKKPTVVSAASLNDLFSENSVIISGAVEHNLPEGYAPFHIEYACTDIRDISPSQLKEKLPLLRRMQKAVDLLDGIARRRIDTADGLQQLAVLPLPQPVIRLLGTIVSPINEPRGAAASAAAPLDIDAILSMVDHDAAPSPAVVPAAPADFVAALTRAGEQEVAPSALLSCKEAIERELAVLGDVIAWQPFFRAARSSWNSLKTLCKIAGRNRAVRIVLHAAPFDAALRHFGDALAACSNDHATPDLVVWDYPVPVDTASLEQLEHCAAIAERLKTMLVASLDCHDNLYKGLMDRIPLRTLFERPEMIPFTRLQKTGAARGIVLCAPDAALTTTPEVVVRGNWLLMLQWMSSLLEHDAPFHLQNHSVALLDAFAFPKFPAETVFEAHRFGITLLRPGTTTTPRVLFGDETSCYGAFLFNLLVNRTMRRAALWISTQAGNHDAETAAPLLAEYLRAELNAYHILSTDGALRVLVTGTALEVTINSETTVAGFPAAFQFSFTLRG
jgi:hypothetical protein